MKNQSHQRILDKINKEIGSDLKNLHKSKNLVATFKQEFDETSNKLSLIDHTVTSDLKTALRQSDTTSQTIDIQVEKIDRFQEKIKLNLEKYENVLDGVSATLTKIGHLEHLVEYFKVLQDILDISNGLKNLLNGKDDDRIVGLYLSLCGDINSSNNIIGRLENVEAFHLKTFAITTAIYWHDLLKEKFSKEFESTLKSIKWPQMGGGAAAVLSESFNPPMEVLNKLVLLAEYLFLIKPPGDRSVEYVKITPSIICPPISTPTQLLLKPFRQRFLYHFNGAKQTNRLDKPEWFFTQILTWAKENHLFVGTHFQTAASLAGYSELNIRLEFVRGLVQLAVEKLCIDIEEISKDDHLFPHLLDETLSFEQELRDSLGYPATFPSALSVLTQAQYITQWLAAEENFSTTKMDDMLVTGNPWEFIDPVNLEELKIPKCVDQFVRLLDAIRERYCVLPQPGHQLQFLNLQLELIDSFRRRLVQLHNSPVDNVSSTKILNAINYLISVLREWGENVHYLHLHAAFVGADAEEITSVFDKAIDEFEHWQKKIIQEFASKIVDHIKARSMPYRHDNWIAMPEQNAKESFILSVTAGEMFQIMVTSLHNLETELSANIFNVTLRLIASQLDNFFIDSMIMNTKFSTGGAAQFNFDMTRNLFALFGQYSRKPEFLFKKIHDACLLLTLAKGSAILLHQTLQANTTHDSNRSTLNEIGVLNLKHVVALDVLERRKDINAY